jgi:hypothetical protein
MEAHLARFESTLASQRGLITLQQLMDGGMSGDQLTRLVRKRSLRRVRPRVFELVGAPGSWERGLVAVVLSVDGSVASHASAARLWDFDPRPEDRYEITIPRSKYAAPAGVSVHRSGTLSASKDVDVRNGVPCTTFERTLCDCTTSLSMGQLGRVLDEGLRRSVATLSRLKDCCERNESGPGRHMSVIRELLRDRGVGFNPGGSRSELQILDVFRRAAIPMPVQQYRIRIEHRTYRPDFAWPDHMVFAEYYGLPFHTGASAVVSDSERMTALSAAGWLPLVFTHASSDREIIERTTEALAQRDARGRIGA